MGMLFSIMSLFIILPIISVVLSDMTENYETYDHRAIANRGVEKEAKVLGLSVLHNVTINGVNPRVIEYEYKNNGVGIKDKFQTLEVEKAEKVKEGDAITVKVLDGQSAIKGLEPYSFPFKLFFILPFLFFAIGFPMFLIGFLPALRNFKLYKTGIVKDAYVQYMIQKDGLPVSGIGRKIVVGYYYMNGSDKIFSESSTIDSLVLFEKKTGDTIKIFVSEDGKKSCLIPKREAIKNNWNINFA